MDFRFSTLLDPASYETEGLCGSISVRKHAWADLEEIGTFRAREDWKKYVGLDPSNKGGLGPKHSIMSITMPECLPERLEIISYADEFAFMYDDLIDISSEEKVNAENDQMACGFREGVRSGKIEATSGKHQMQAKILNEMMEIDHERAMAAMKAWSTFVETSSGRQHHKFFSTLEQYLPYRCMDVGQMFWHALVVFGYALTIKDEEMHLCKQLSQSAVVAASLTNDLFSYEKEHEAATKAGLSETTNALCVLMREHQIPLEEAELKCRERIKQEVADFEKVVAVTRNRNDISQDLKRYIEVIQYSVSGNLVWSLTCPRYHKDVSYNELQLRRETFGVENVPTIGRSPPLGSESTASSGQACCKRRHSMDELSNGCTKKSNSPHQRRSPDVTQLISINDLVREMPALSGQIISEPSRYINALPSKRIRDKAIDALNVWLEVPLNNVSIIKTITELLHSSSLMLDDLQDASPLRRGKPSTHAIFGEAQTINTATFQWVLALEKLGELGHSEGTAVFVDEMKQLFIGQSYDLHWTASMRCPSMLEYVRMVDGKTGGLFRLLSRLMLLVSPKHVDTNLDTLCRLLGRYFQIRDDYQNLISSEYDSQKGFCEDLDEGKFSLPLIHLLKSSDKGLQLVSLLSERHRSGGCTLAQKRFILDEMETAGSFTFTVHLLNTIHAGIETEIGVLEKSFNCENHQLRLLVNILKV